MKKNILKLICVMMLVVTVGGMTFSLAGCSSSSYGIPDGFYKFCNENGEIQIPDSGWRIKNNVAGLVTSNSVHTKFKIIKKDGKIFFEETTKQGQEPVFGQHEVEYNELTKILTVYRSSAAKFSFYKK